MSLLTGRRDKWWAVVPISAPAASHIPVSCFRARAGILALRWPKLLQLVSPVSPATHFSTEPCYLSSVLLVFPLCHPASLLVTVCWPCSVYSFLSLPWTPPDAPGYYLSFISVIQTFPLTIPWSVTPSIYTCIESIRLLTGLVSLRLAVFLLCSFLLMISRTTLLSVLSWMPQCLTLNHEAATQTPFPSSSPPPAPIWMGQCSR